MCKDKEVVGENQFPTPKNVYSIWQPIRQPPKNKKKERTGKKSLNIFYPWIYFVVIGMHLNVLCAVKCSNYGIHQPLADNIYIIHKQSKVRNDPITLHN